MEQLSKMLTLDAAANMLKVGTPTVQSLISRGILTAQTRAGQTVVAYDDIVRFLREDQRHLLEEGQPPDQSLMLGDEAD